MRLKIGQSRSPIRSVFATIATRSSHKQYDKRDSQQGFPFLYTHQGQSLGVWQTSVGKVGERLVKGQLKDESKTS